MNSDFLPGQIPVDGWTLYMTAEGMLERDREGNVIAYTDFRQLDGGSLPPNFPTIKDADEKP